MLAISSEPVACIQEEGGRVPFYLVICRAHHPPYNHGLLFEVPLPQPRGLNAPLTSSLDKTVPAPAVATGERRIKINERALYLWADYKILIYV